VQQPDVVYVPALPYTLGGGLVTHGSVVPANHTATLHKMSHMMYNALVFDFFGVICSEVAPFWLDRHFSAEDAVKVKATVVHAADIGDVSQQGMFLCLSEQTGVPAHQIELEWLQLARIDHEVVRLLDIARRQYRIALLTNSPSQFVRRLLRDNDLAKYFEVIVVSSEQHCAKPDPVIYNRALQDLKVDACQALMIDDNPANVEGAKSVGMGGILFRSSDQLRSAIYSPRVI